MSAPLVLPQMLARSAAAHGERVAVADAGRTLTYGELDEKVSGLARALRAQGLEAGERVAIALESSWQYVVALYGAHRAGAVAVPLNVQAKGQDLSRWLRHSDARFLIAGSGLRELPSVLQDIGQELVLVDVEATGPANTRLPDLDARMPATIMYTSGTTGEPKGVLLSHGNLASNACSIADYLGLCESSSIVTILPFYYAYGSSVLHSHLARGGRIVIEKGFTFPHLVMAAVARERATGFAGVPSTFALMLSRVDVSQYDLSSLEYLTQAGGAMSPTLTRQVCEAFPGRRLFVMYGQTEATSRISYLEPRRLHDKLGSVGKPLPGVQWELRGDYGSVCPVGEVGQLWVKGPNVMMGYWRNPAATDRVLAGGWLDTGDQGHLDAEGFLFLAGRRSDIIKVGAHRVHPQDIEAVISELPGVHEVAVVGMDDAVLGEVTRALVVLRPGSELSVQQIRRHCLENLAGYKVPKVVEFVADLPRTASGKVKRHGLINRENA